MEFQQLNWYRKLRLHLIDVDGIFIQKAREKDTGVEQSVTIQGALNLNETEVEDMLS
jgi:molecular chaperone DnaK (HSP70)